MLAVGREAIMTTAVERSIAWIKEQDGNLDPSFLIKRYNEPHRKYHNLWHIEHVLCSVESQIERYDLQPKEQLALHVAAWYHDAIYDPMSKDNEDLSTNLFVTIAQKAQVAVGLLPAVVSMIQGSKNHTRPYSFIDALFYDADLAILGCDSFSYRLYAAQVKAEYNVDDEKWRVGRIAFLESMLNRKFIFHTSWGVTYEDQAYRNMLKELASLRGSHA